MFTKFSEAYTSVGMIKKETKISYNTTGALPVYMSRACGFAGRYTQQ